MAEWTIKRIVQFGKKTYNVQPEDTLLVNYQTLYKALFDLNRTLRARGVTVINHPLILMRSPSVTYSDISANRHCFCHTQSESESSQEGIEKGDDVDRTNELTRKFCDSQERCTFLDINSIFQNGDGSARVRSYRTGCCAYPVLIYDLGRPINWTLVTQVVTCYTIGYLVHNCI